MLQVCSLEIPVGGLKCNPAKRRRNPALVPGFFCPSDLAMPMRATGASALSVGAGKWGRASGGGAAVSLLGIVQALCASEGRAGAAVLMSFGPGSEPLQIRPLYKAPVPHRSLRRLNTRLSDRCCLA